MLEWYKEQIGVDPEGPSSDDVWANLMDEARNSPIGANGIFFLPHFNGTSCPNLDPRSLGAFLGLNDSTQRKDMVRAVIEGLDFAFLDMLKALELGAGRKAEEIIAIGGAVRNEFWMQNKADVSGRPVVTPEIDEATALGAAMLAGTGAGVYSSLDEAAQKVYKPGKVFEPNQELVPVYGDLFTIYQDIYPALAGVNDKIFKRFRM
jgi:xylulokinase